MRIIVGNISAVYSGRGDTELAPYKRIVIYKNDGSISIHGEKGFKPLNYMTATKELIEEINKKDEKVWICNGKKESLKITFHEIINEINLDLGNNDPGYSAKNGQESQLQEWLSKNIHHISPTARFIEREHQTGSGPVDLIAEDDNNILYVIEVKRSSTLNTVGQVLRYIDAMEENMPSKTLIPVIAAVDIKESTYRLAEKKNVKCVVLPKNWQNINNETIVEKVSPGTLSTLFDE